MIVFDEPTTLGSGDGFYIVQELTEDNLKLPSRKTKTPCNSICAEIWDDKNQDLRK